MKILLVADFHHFSTKDLFTAYDQALRMVGVDYNVAETYDLVDTRKVCHMSPDAAIGLIMAKLLNVDNGFTHCLVISGIIFPEWFFKTAKKCGISVSVIATDDPHASTPLVRIKPYLDYWFTNEKTLEDIPNKIVYVPTATGTNVPNCDKDKVPDQYKNDVVFVGTVYPDRVKPLEDACKFCEENGLNIKIYGPILNAQRDSIIRKYTVEGIIDNTDTKLLYRGARVVINIDRNVFWNPNEQVGNSMLVGNKEPYSMNPRAYEIALCQTLQLYVDARPEARDVFGDNIIYSDSENITKALTYIFNEMTKEEESKKIYECFERVKKSGLYLFRAQKIVNCLKQGEDNE